MTQSWHRHECTAPLSNTALHGAATGQSPHPCIETCSGMSSPKCPRSHLHPLHEIHHAAPHLLPVTAVWQCSSQRGSRCLGCRWERHSWWQWYR
jgi:hypothetical protein